MLPGHHGRTFSVRCIGFVLALSMSISAFSQIPVVTKVSQAPSPASPLKGKRFGAWGDSITAIFGNQWQNVVIARTGMTLGFQDARPGRSYRNAFELYGGDPTAGLANFAISSVSVRSGHPGTVTFRGSGPAFPARTVVSVANLTRVTALKSAQKTPIALTVGAGATSSSFSAPFDSSEDINSMPDSGIAIPPGRNQGWVMTANGVASNTGTTGNTLAQDLANLDCMIVFLGTNDPGPWVALGAAGDSPTTASEYGYINRFATAIHTANPDIRLLFVTPYWSTSRRASSVPIVAAITSVASTFDDPVLNLYQNLGFNSLNAAVTLQADGLHPSTPIGFQKFLGPAIADFVESQF